MREELIEIGDLFRKKRESLNLSLKEVESGTSIRSSYLAAIEEGSIMEQISGVYAQGFMKQYATFIGLDSEELLKEYAPAFRIAEQKHDFAYGIGTLESRGQNNGGVRWLPNLLWALAAAAVLTVAYYLAKFVGLFS